MQLLPPDVRDYEPRSSLVGGEDGLYFIRKIISGAGRVLKNGGWCLLEIGAGQSSDVKRLFREARIYGDFLHKRHQRYREGCESSMEKIIVEGGKRLEGEIVVSGAKNAVLPLMAACILAEGKNIITNVPDLADVRTMAKLLQILGADVEYDNGTLSIDSSDLNNWEAPYDLVKTMRASVLVLGPAHRQVRESPRFASRRLRHRGEADRPASERSLHPGLENPDRGRLCRNERAQAHGRNNTVRRFDSDRDREPHSFLGACGGGNDTA